MERVWFTSTSIEMINDMKVTKYICMVIHILFVILGIPVTNVKAVSYTHLTLPTILRV